MCPFGVTYVSAPTLWNGPLTHIFYQYLVGFVIHT